MFPTCDSYKCYGVTVLRMGRKRRGESDTTVHKTAIGFSSSDDVWPRVNPLFVFALR